MHDVCVCVREGDATLGVHVVPQVSPEGCRVCVQATPDDMHKEGGDSWPKL